MCNFLRSIGDIHNVLYTALHLLCVPVAKLPLENSVFGVSEPTHWEINDK